MSKSSYVLKPHIVGIPPALISDVVLRVTRSYFSYDLGNVGSTNRYALS
jgi:hypothetical protein